MPPPDHGKVPVNKKTLKQVFQETAMLDRSLNFQGPGNIRPDSRYAITEICEDHVRFKLLGDEIFVLPYSAISMLRVAPKQITIHFR